MIMPLSKKRNRDRMRLIRLHVKKRTEGVQPKGELPPPFNEGSRYNPCGVDADGNLIYEEG